ncbi:UDP-N-acetylmuramoyl-tripeptide--D-alanyl-D-alanine ligase [Candidatus Erwinia haradaeae]|uniref:UDP-N-acetylmuramoyl-tripeptide--D-alanyl-D-alanine ligase n=1 Tax=Candidatus Erwinia haradaeae TaxID=1922217 RepID=A0A803FTR7_9GAMM|nr:UDP-N-acetylmuramoyl-tripeptide--D-alanyl-D-alanine ligase [Candidatus Erwinia haradaeae]VFP88197.1 UDP-N-acetylmuramoyl-tripeptide--D-alanyl-D-alanine ligase {ECO:0000255/HAMAP-Rule:MF_02019,ECO:0000305} [Candidatus Erwinia haradaeae]
MMPITLQTIAVITNGRLYGKNISISSISIDTRKAKKGSLFIALQGKNYDAHNFIHNAINAGCACCVVNKPLSIGFPHLVVKDTRIALENLSVWFRKKSKARIVAITGSSGKTSVKEMTAAILQQCGKTLYTHGNLNNALGVPITLLRLRPIHEYAVIELGAQTKGEITYTSDLIQPDSVLINNISVSHLEGFETIEGIAQGKGEIFNALSINGTAIINSDSNDWINWQLLLHQQNIWRFSLHKKQDSDFYSSNIISSIHGTRFILHSPAGSVEIILQVLGEHNIANALASSALALSIGAPLSAISYGLNNFKGIEGRLFPVMLNKNKLLIDDSYNANMGSMISAINFLKTMPGYRVLIVGDIKELGSNADKYHAQIGFMINATSIEKVLSIGTLSYHISHNSGVGEHFCDLTTLAARSCELLILHHQITILVKGSRSMSMEQIVRILQEQDVCLFT